MTLRCPAGRFQIASGQTSCNPCPENQFQPEVGKYLCQDCEIEIGTGFGSAPGSSNCQLCQADFFYRVEGEGCEPCEGEYDGYECTEAGESTDTVPLKPGFHKLSPNLNTPLPCPTPEWCIGGALDDGSSICREGHNPIYAFCSVRANPPSAREQGILV